MNAARLVRCARKFSAWETGREKHAEMRCDAHLKRGRRSVADIFGIGSGGGGGACAGRRVCGW